MSDQPCQTPLIELARSVPIVVRAEWETQWFEGGAPCGHSIAPVGKYLHDMADHIEELEAENERLNKEVDALVELLRREKVQVEELKILLEEGIRRVRLLLEIKVIAGNGPITRRASRRWVAEALAAVQEDKA